MVILLSGASHTGKTRLAQQLMEHLHIPYLSIDHLKMGLIRSGQTTLTPTDDRQLTDYLWSIVREMVQTVIENHQNLIVEGCYIPFHWKGDFFQLSAKCKGILAQSGNSGSQLNGLNIRPVGIPGIAAVRTAGHLAASGQGQRPILQGPGAVFPPVSFSRSQGMGPGLPICTAVVHDIVLSG